MLDPAMDGGHQTLDAVEGQSILQTVGIHRPSSQLATSPEDAAEAAARIGFPVALKLISSEISHKTNVGGVLLSIHDAVSARDGYQTLMGRVRATQAHMSLRGVQCSGWSTVARR